MKQYLKLLEEVFDEGVYRSDRTGTGTYSLFGNQVEYDVSEKFPLLTTKKVHFRSVVFELLWMLRGETNVKFLHDNGVSIWDEWADENGDLGKIYGKQWRNFFGVDQIKDAIDQIKNNPTSRRIIVSAWNPHDLPDMALPPCHCFFQFYVQDDRLSLKLYQRSADLFLGVPFNIAQYSLLLYIVAKICGKKPYRFIHSFGDVHIYKNHSGQVTEQLSRNPYELPTLEILGDEPIDIDNIDASFFERIKLNDYKCHPAIKAEVSV